LPPGAKNYLTREGAARLREELNRLIQVDRVQVAASPGDVDVKRQLQMVDQRIHHLEQSLRYAVVVSPHVAPEDRSGLEQPSRWSAAAPNCAIASWD
jgi:transcription elongation factor GreB